MYSLYHLRVTLVLIRTIINEEFVGGNSTTFITWTLVAETIFGASFGKHKQVANNQ